MVQIRTPQCQPTVSEAVRLRSTISELALPKPRVALPQGVLNGQRVPRIRNHKWSGAPPYPHPLCACAGCGCGGRAHARGCESRHVNLQATEPSGQRFCAAGARSSARPACGQRFHLGAAASTGIYTPRSERAGGAASRRREHACVPSLVFAGELALDLRSVTVLPQDGARERSSPTLV